MDIQESNPSPDPLALTPRQRRLRVLTILILAAVIAMIFVGMTHPFFRPGPRPAVMTPRLEKAIQVKVLTIGFYWISCTLLTTSLFVLAWLDLREVRRKLLYARRDMWKDILEQHRERRAESSSPADEQ